MADLLEALMLICCGLSWPMSIYKSLKSRTARGKSLTFEIIIWIGYMIGIIRKGVLINSGENFDWLFYLALAFYIINLVQITFDMLIYARNKKLDAMRA